MRLFYFVLYLVIIIISTFLFKKTNKSLAFENVSLISMLYYDFMIFHIVGVGLVIIGIRSRNFSFGHISLTENEMIIVALFISFTFFIMSFILFLLDQKYKVKINRENILFATTNTSLTFGLIILMILILFGLIIIGIENKGFPIFAVFNRWSPLKIGITRTKFHTSIPYIKNLLLAVGSPILAGMSYVLFKCYRKSIISLFLLIFSWLIFIFTSIMTTAKLPIVQCALFFIILNYYTGNKLKTRKLFQYGIFLLLILLFFNIGIEGNVVNINTSIINLSERVFLSQNNGVFFIYEYFKDNNFLGVKGVSNKVAQIFNTEYIEPHKLMMRTYLPGAFNRGTAGEMSTLFIGEAFAVGGFFVTFLSIILTTIIFYLFHLFFEKIVPKNAFFITIHVYFTVYWVMKIGSGFFTNFILNWTYIFIFFIFILGFIPYLAVKHNLRIKNKT